MDWITLITAVAGVLGSVVAWFAGRRKQDNDFLNDQTNSINTLTESYQGTIDKFTNIIEKFVEVKQENAELKGQMEAMQKELDSFKNVVAGLKGENTKLRNRIKLLEQLMKDNGIECDEEDATE